MCDVKVYGVTVMAKVQKKALRSWSSKQAVAILAVDNIKVSDFGVDLLKRREEGLVTYDQAREEIRARARVLAAKKKHKISF